VLRLPRLPAIQHIVDKNGAPTVIFQQFWQQAMALIETSINGIQAALDAAAAANTAAVAANAAATTANTAATAASSVATTAAADNAIANSGVTGLTLTATDAGTSATITVSANTRVYADGSSVAVSGGSITGLAYSTTFYVYYHDAGHVGGAVTYLASTSAANAIQTGDVHSVGAVITPAAAAPPSTGKANLAPGIVDA
jgi:hypothetical protein